MDATLLQCKGKDQLLKISFQLVIKVVVKASGFTPLGEANIPSEVLFDAQRIPVVVVEGVSTYCVRDVRSGDAIGDSEGSLGFSSIAGVVRSKSSNKHYAVTCKHVTDGSLNDLVYPQQTAGCSFASPPPAHRKFKLVRSLNRPVHDKEGKFIMNLDSHVLLVVPTVNASTVRRQMIAICDDNLRDLSSSGDITLNDIEYFTRFGAVQLGHSKDVLHPAATTRGVLCGGLQVAIDGDIALVPLTTSSSTTTSSAPHHHPSIVSLDQLATAWNSNVEVNVDRIGASTTSTGTVLRPGHIRAGSTTAMGSFYSDRTKNNQIIYHNQILMELQELYDIVQALFTSLVRA